MEYDTVLCTMLVGLGSDFLLGESQQIMRIRASRISMISLAPSHPDWR